ncbi:MAG: ATP-binding protein [Bacteroidia bacterium]|jgi:PAS domain S-box-containing protein
MSYATNKKTFQARILQRDRVAENTFRIELKITEGQFSFQAGQYIWLKLDNLLYPDPRGNRRAFSIASSPKEDTIVIIFRGEKSGFKKTLLKMPLKSSVEIIGPFGFFIAPLLPKAKNHIFVTGGVGVAPFLSVIRNSLNIKNAPKIHLIYSESAKNHLIPEVLKLQKKVKNHKFLKISINIGPLDENFIKKNVKIDKNSFWYFTGPAGMINKISSVVSAIGIPKNRMMFEENYPEFASEKMLDSLELENNQPKETNIYKLAADDSLIHTVITDINGRILYANQACARITGYSIQEILGNTPRLWGGLMNQSFYEKLWQTIKTKRKPFASKITNRKKNGEQYIAQLSIAPIIEANGKLTGFIVSEIDITNLEEIDQVKSEFISFTSHQLKSPLTVINWYSELLLASDAGKLNQKQKKYLEQIYHSSQRMVELISSLLNVSRLELGTFTIQQKSTNISNISKTIVKEMQPLIKKKKIVLKEKYAPNLPKVNIDQKFAGMIFQNLISNAIKYTPEKGKVEVKIKLSKKGKVMNGEKNTTDSIFISVADYGCGIPKAQQKQIFTKLFRADNAKKQDKEGTGLGLYIVKSIMEHTGGRIWFESTENKGTTFFMLLPLSDTQKKK